jgi:hypothetical protein
VCACVCVCVCIGVGCEAIVCTSARTHWHASESAILNPETRTLNPEPRTPNTNPSSPCRTATETRGTWRQAPQSPASRPPAAPPCRGKAPGTVSPPEPATRCRVSGTAPKRGFGFSAPCLLGRVLGRGLRQGGTRESSRECRV